MQEIIESDEPQRSSVTPPPLPVDSDPPTFDEILRKLEAKNDELYRMETIGDRSLPPSKRPPPEKVIKLIEKRLPEKSTRYHIAFWGAIAGFFCGIIGYFNEITMLVFIIMVVSVAFELLIIRVAKRFSDRRLRKDLYSHYWQKMSSRNNLPAERVMLLSPTINVLSLLYGFLSLSRIAMAFTGLMCIAFMRFPASFVGLLVLCGLAIYGAVKLSQQMIADSKWKKLGREIFRV